LLNVEKEVVKEICRSLAIEMSEEESEKISRIPDLTSLCSFSKSFHANLQRGMKYQDSINTAFSSIQVPFLAVSVGAILLDDFLNSIDDDGSLFSLCENGLKADPDDPQMYWRMAKLCLEKKNAKKALEYADKGIAVSPAYARNYLIAAMAYEELGDSQRANEMGEIAVGLMNIEG
jgi:tetratricopeptide (TPR) repeat protein